MRLSVQLYTVRDQMADDPVGTLSKLRDFGLQYVEGGGSFGAPTAAEAKTILDDLGLKVSGAHTGLEALENDYQKSIDDLLTLECPFAIVPWVGKDVYAGGWDRFGHRLEEIGQKVKAAGLGFAYHNHNFEFENEGKPGLDILFDSSDPDLVQSELDLAWVQIGGQDPAAYTTKLRSRLPLIHLKDFDSSKDPIWQAAGKGVVDCDACLKAAKAGNVKFAAIELDAYDGDPLEAVRESVKFFNDRGIS
jgi:sugar phosphate isomerase/epimerase